jgi:hypothetical protein
MEKVYYGLVCENLKENLSNPFVISQTQQNLYSTLTHTKPDQAVSQLESLMGMLIRANSTPKRGDLRLSAVPSPSHSQQLVNLVASPSPKTVAQQALNKNLSVTTSPRPRSYSADISENTSISPTTSGWSVSSSAGDLRYFTPLFISSSLLFPTSHYLLFPFSFLSSRFYFLFSCKSFVRSSLTLLFSLRFFVPMLVPVLHQMVK